MAKKLLLALLFSTGYIFSATVFASNALNPPVHSPLPAFACAAPPPDSFRVTSIGYNFVSVAWNPVWPGADHILTVLEENTSGGWDSLYSVTLINTTSYSVTNTIPTKRYQFKIRTICLNGDPSSLWVGLNPDHGLILELTVGGRTPIAPSPTSCIEMDYVTNEWLGFELSRRDGENGTIKSRFEYVVDKNPTDNVVGIVSRLDAGNILVAANHDNYWPDPAYITQSLQFTVGEIRQGLLDGFGVVNVEIYPFGAIVDICATIFDDTYTFTPLVASAVEGCVLCPNGDPHGGVGRMTNGSANGSIRVQSPCSEHLRIFFPDTDFKSGMHHFQLLDVNGRIMFKEHIDVLEHQMSIPIGHFAPGFYVLQIETNSQIQNIKVLVSE